MLLATEYLIIKIRLLGTNKQDLGLYDLPEPVGYSSGLDTGVQSFRPFRGSIALFGIALGTFIDHYAQFAYNQSWYSVSLPESSTSLLLVKQSNLTGTRMIHANIRKTNITNIDNKMKLSLSYLCILLIVDAHDTEVNPGPYKPKYPCQLCQLACKWGQRCVQCDTCNGWYHADCMNMEL